MKTLQCPIEVYTEFSEVLNLGQTNPMYALDDILQSALSDNDKVEFCVRSPCVRIVNVTQTQEEGGDHHPAAIRLEVFKWGEAYFLGYSVTSGNLETARRKWAHLSREFIYSSRDEESAC